MQVDLAPVDAHLRPLPDRVREVRRGDRAEQRAGRAGLDVEAQLERLELRGDLARLVERLRLVAGAPLVALPELRHLGGRRRLGEPPRQQVVPGEPAGDRHDVAAQPHLLDVFSEDDVHGASR